MNRVITGPSNSSAPIPLRDAAGPSSSSLPPQQVERTIPPSETEKDTGSFPETPEDKYPDHSSREHEDAATIRRGYSSNGTDNELESDSEKERNAQSRDGPTNRQRETETSFSVSRQQPNQYTQQILQDQNVPAHAGDSFGADTPRRLHSTGTNATQVSRSYSHDSPTSTPASHSLISFRNSVIPPPRPPPSGPLPTRPRIASGSSIPSQLLNQPLPPLPPIPKPQVLCFSPISMYCFPHFI